MSSLQEFHKIFQTYASKFGHTFTTIGLYPDMDAFVMAYEQMQQCLNGDRAEPVTQESIGQTGEGIV